MYRLTGLTSGVILDGVTGVLQKSSIKMFLYKRKTRSRILFCIGGLLSGYLEKDRDTLTDRINNGIITMDKKVEDAFAFRLKTFEKMRRVPF